MSFDISCLWKYYHISWSHDVNEKLQNLDDFICWSLIAFIASLLRFLYKLMFLLYQKWLAFTTSIEPSQSAHPCRVAAYFARSRLHWLLKPHWLTGQYMFIFVYIYFRLQHFKWLFCCNTTPQILTQSPHCRKIHRSKWYDYYFSMPLEEEGFGGGGLLVSL